MSEMNLEGKLYKNLEDSCIKAYKAGQQSMQAKIDDIQSKLSNMEFFYNRKKNECAGLQKENSEMQEMMLRDGALATKAQIERNELREVVKSQQETIENLTNQKKVVNITVDDSNHFEISEKVEKTIKRGARLTRHQIDL